MKVLHVVGARPNFMKMAPVVAALESWNSSTAGRELRFEQTLVHTGQHYDERLSGVFFDQLGLPEPDEWLGVGSGSQAQQTARLLEALEPVVLDHRPDLVVVPGDVNSACAGALVAAKLSLPVAHVEAGLRSGDRGMLEEINRIVIDHVAELLLTTCADGDRNLLREGVAAEHIVRAGNTMIDTLSRLLAPAVATAAQTRRELALGDAPFVLVTLHRPSNVDDPEQLRRLLGMLDELSCDLPVVFPVHLRTRARMASLADDMANPPGGRVITAEPLGYLQFLGLMAQAAAVITDSGGVQEETTMLGVPCVTVRTTTERPITITKGTNRLADPGDPQAILEAAHAAVAGGVASPPPVIELWDGHAGERVAQAVARWAQTLGRWA